MIQSSYHYPWCNLSITGSHSMHSICFCQSHRDRNMVNKYDIDRRGLEDGFCRSTRGAVMRELTVFRILEAHEVIPPGAASTSWRDPGSLPVLRRTAIIYHKNPTHLSSYCCCKYYIRKLHASINNEPLDVSGVFFLLILRRNSLNHAWFLY